MNTDTLIASPVKQTTPMLHHFHKRLDDGRVFPIAQVLRIVRAAKENPSMEFGQSLRRSWGGGTGRDILREFSGYVQDEVNRRGGIMLREPNEKRIQRRLDLERARLGCECRWCGSHMAWKPQHARFCELSCYRSYYS